MKTSAFPPHCGGIRYQYSYSVQDKTEPRVRSDRNVQQAEKKQRRFRAYQFGLSLGDLAVILLQDFFQLLPLRFFFLLDG